LQKSEKKCNILDSEGNVLPQNGKFIEFIGQGEVERAQASILYSLEMEGIPGEFPLHFAKP
jgi:hypothetical protein